MKIALLLFAASALYGQTASGTLTIGKDQFELKHAGAVKIKDGTRIVLADKPIPPDVLDDEAQVWDLKDKGYHGLQIDIAENRQNHTTFVISSTMPGTLTMSGTFHPERLSVFTAKRVEGSLEAQPEETAGTVVGYQVKFAADIMPPEAAPTAVDQAAAVGKESTKAYLALVAAIHAGDKQKILDLAPPDKRAVIDTPQFPEMLKLVQAMTPTNIRVLKATETGDHAKLLASGSMDGAKQRGKIYLNRVNGKWTMVSESWGKE